MKTKKNWDYRNSHFLIQALLLCIILILLFITPSCDLFGTDDLTLVWSDEFNGSVLDTDVWRYDIGTGTSENLTGWGNNELQFYTSRTENIRIEDFGDGNRGLVIEAKKEIYYDLDSDRNMNYTSARINTKGKKEWTYGRFEARMRLPDGQGIWPAFWMLGSNIIDGVSWPACGEIDIMEMFGLAPDVVLGTIHYGYSYPTRKYAGRDYTLSLGRFSDDFHTFAIEWEPGEIRWYVDNDLYSIQRSWYSSTGDWPAPFNSPFYILLNLAVGGNWLEGQEVPEDFPPQKLYVDYIRIYQ